MSSRCHWYVPVRFEMKTVLSASFPTKAQEVKYGWMLLDPSPVSRRTRPPVFGSFDSLISPRTSWTLPRPPLAAGAGSAGGWFRFLRRLGGHQRVRRRQPDGRRAAGRGQIPRGSVDGRHGSPCEVTRSDPDLSRLAMIVPFLSSFTIPRSLAPMLQPEQPRPPVKRPQVEHLALPLEAAAVGVEHGAEAQANPLSRRTGQGTSVRSGETPREAIPAMDRRAACLDM